MKTFFLFIVLVVLAGCGDPNYKEDETVVVSEKTLVFHKYTTSFQSYTTMVNR